MEAQDTSAQLDKQIILSVTGSDHPEIITTISEILYRFKGNLEASRFNQIKDKFSGLLAISINSCFLPSFVTCLESLSSDKVRFEFYSLDDKHSVADFENEKISFEISIWGLKKRNVNIEILRELSKNHLTIDSINTQQHRDVFNQVGFSTQLLVSTEYVIDLDEVEQQLQELAKRLSINIMVHSEEERLQEAI